LHITDADREAANALRVALADICGFWHSPGDDSPICQALARHRIDAERRTAEQLKPIVAPTIAPVAAPVVGARNARDFVPGAMTAGERPRALPAR
jgi:hypothetical protein